VFWCRLGHISIKIKLKVCRERSEREKNWEKLALLGHKKKHWSAAVRGCALRVRPPRGSASGHVSGLKGHLRVNWSIQILILKTTHTFQLHKSNIKLTKLSLHIIQEQISTKVPFHTHFVYAFYGAVFSCFTRKNTTRDCFRVIP